MVIVGLEAAVHLTEEKKGKSVKKEVAATTELHGVSWAECSFHSGKKAKFSSGKLHCPFQGGELLCGRRKFKVLKNKEQV